LIILIILGEEYAPHYAVFSNLLSLHSSSFHIFYSAPCFAPLQTHRQNYSFVNCNFYVIS
jgi:hypothetical protein